MQARNLTVDKVKKNIDFFKSSIESIRNSSLTSHKLPSLSAQGKEVCDNIIVKLASRYSFSDHLMLAQLFDKERFGEYKSKFPDDILNLVPKCFPMVDHKKLKEELKVFYGRVEMHCSKLTDLLAFF